MIVYLYSAGSADIFLDAHCPAGEAAVHPTSRKDLLLCHKTKGACVMPFSARMNPYCSKSSATAEAASWI